jgi:cytochrome c peroxidase
MPWFRAALLPLLAALPFLAGAGQVRGETLVDQGRRLFFAETFGGNGRTCGTCHPAANDFTLDPAFIARLPASDPLFVHERDPNLAGLEHPTLLRQLALIQVHADGFAAPPVLRGVPHLLGIARSLQAEFGTITPPGATTDLPEATGWSGDGGALRDFAIGAIRQHMPRSLARRAGVDFRLPTDQELRALEAYMLTLGRSEAQEVDIANGTGVTFAAPVVERGRELFNNEVSGSCAFCHRNATALNESGFNGMFAIGVARQPRTRALRADRTLAFDGGFGASPALGVPGRGGFGDERFNAPSIIEAADTAPLFHDNSAANIEEAVRFYTTATFANSPEGQALPTIRLGEADIVAIAAMLRTVNAIENIRAADALLAEARGVAKEAALPKLRLARKETKEAIHVLVAGPQALSADARLQLARSFTVQAAAARAGTAASRDRQINQASGLLRAARSLMLAP